MRRGCGPAEAEINPPARRASVGKPSPKRARVRLILNQADPNNERILVTRCAPTRCPHGRGTVPPHGYDWASPNSVISGPASAQPQPQLQGSPVANQRSHPQNTATRPHHPSSSMRPRQEHHNIRQPLSPFWSRSWSPTRSTSPSTTSASRSSTSPLPMARFRPRSEPS